MPLKNGIWTPDENGPWHPVLSERQMELYDEFEHKYILCTGGRWGAKTLGVAHKIWRHLWETPGARGVMIAKTQKSAKEGGAWQDLIEVVGPEWIASGQCGVNGMPIEFTTRDGAGTPGPRTDPTTRTVSFRIRNYWGGESEMMLFSLDNDKEVEAKLKSTRFSLIWFSELSNFQDRSVFNVSKEQLRMVHLKDNQHIWMGDTNPSDDGENHWVWKVWFDEIKWVDHPSKVFQKQLKRFDFNIDENPFLSAEKKEEFKGSYLYDPKEYERHVEGKWVKGKQGDRHFAHLLQDHHFVEPAIEADVNTELFLTGWDLGDVNHAAVILEKRMIKDISYYMVLDELVFIGEEVGTAEFAYQMLEKINNLELYYEHNFTWRHWSDDTALNRWRAGIEGVDATIVLAATDGKIDLEPVEKPDSSIQTSIKMIKRLLRENRLFIGANCPHVREMLEDLKVGDKRPVEDSGSNKLKHIFDALRYPIYMEERIYMEEKLDVKASVRLAPIHV